MKLTPYKKILGMLKEKKEELLAPIRAAEMKKHAELEMTKIEGKIIEKQQKVQEICQGYPIDFDGMIKALDEIGLLERRKKQFEVIVKEMFPD